jgi:hypothetical protein
MEPVTKSRFGEQSVLGCRKYRDQNMLTGLEIKGLDWFESSIGADDGLYGSHHVWIIALAVPGPPNETSSAARRAARRTEEAQRTREH